MPFTDLNNKKAMYYWQIPIGSQQLDDYYRYREVDLFVDHISFEVTGLVYAHHVDHETAVCPMDVLEFALDNPYDLTGQTKNRFFKQF